MKIDEKLWDGGWWNFFGCYIWWENGKEGKKYLNNMRIRRKSIENEGKKAISQHPEYYIIFFPFSVPYIFFFLHFRSSNTRDSNLLSLYKEKQNILCTIL